MPLDTDEKQGSPSVELTGTRAVVPVITDSPLRGIWSRELSLRIHHFLLAN